MSEPESDGMILSESESLYNPNQSVRNSPNQTVRNRPNQTIRNRPNQTVRYQIEKRNDKMNLNILPWNGYPAVKIGFILMEFVPEKSILSIFFFYFEYLFKKIFILNDPLFTVHFSICCYFVLELLFLFFFSPFLFDFQSIRKRNCDLITNWNLHTFLIHSKCVRVFFLLSFEYIH